MSQERIGSCKGCGKHISIDEMFTIEVRGEQCTDTFEMCVKSKMPYALSSNCARIKRVCKDCNIRFKEGRLEVFR